MRFSIFSIFIKGNELDSVRYPYDEGDNLENRHSYTYAPYQGMQFFVAWEMARDVLISGVDLDYVSMPCIKMPYPVGNEVKTSDLLEALSYQLFRNEKRQTDSFHYWLNWIIQRFEVSKRLHVSYKLYEGRAKPYGTYRDLSLYVRLAEVLVAAYSELDKLPALNALIKCLDTLYSVKDDLTTAQRQRVGYVAGLERQFISHLCSKVDETAKQCNSDLSCAQVKDYSCKVLGNVTLLLADTMRSRAYAQSLLAYGFRVGNILVLTSSSQKKWGQAEQRLAPPVLDAFGDVFIPDLRVSLEDTCQKLSASIEVLDTGSVNSQVVIETLKVFSPELVIFSGFGGEIVHGDVLSAAGPFLHMHAGWLPEFRGSTTTYYSFMISGKAGVSAILLSPGIDTGKIFFRELYPLPPSDMEIDYYYDGVIRSDAMVRVLTHYYTHKQLPDGQVQEQKEGETYYVIHPLLKTVSILMVRGQSHVFA
ncbi:formyltransferase family protein [Halomonas sp. AOP13-D3-9]